MKHTPGPWYVVEYVGHTHSKSDWVGEITSASGKKVYNGSFSFHAIQSRADADLIARAPELEHLARDLVALLFWRWRKNADCFKKSMESGANTRDFNYMIACQEVESYQNFKAARDYLYSKTKGDE
jgi:hypothetical protein